MSKATAKTQPNERKDWLKGAKARRFEVIKFKVVRGPKGSSVAIAKALSRRLKKSQRLIYLKHNTLVNQYAYWTALIENV